jgi:ATP-binding cassette subfamily C protein
MIFFNFIIFFISKLTLKDFVKIIFNYILIFGLILLDIIFVVLIFLIINFSQNISQDGFFIELIQGKITEVSIYFDINILYSKILFLTFVLILKNIIFVFQNWYFFNYIYSMSADISKKVFRNFLSINYEKFININISTYTKILTKDLDNVVAGIFQSILSITGDLIYVSILIFYSFKLIEIEFFSSHIFLFLLLSFILIFTWKKNVVLGSMRNLLETKIFVHINETLSAIKEIKIYNKIENFSLDFYSKNKKFYKIRTISGVLNLLPKTFFEISAFLFIFISYSNFDGNTVNFVSSIAILVFVLLRILPPINKINLNLNSCLNYHKSLDLIKKNLSNELINKDFKKKSIYNLTLRNINYFYINNRKKIHILKNINLNFQVGKIYGLCGKSGIGKTTLLNIISGLIKPKSGQILINEKKIKSSNICKFFKIGFVNQNPYIIDGSIFENITFNFNNVSKKINDDKKKIKKLLNKFNLEKYSRNSFLESNNLSLNQKLSGGEKQRISFLRCIFANPDLLILDEPTAALDKKNEKIFINFLKNYKKNKIIILTTHRSYLKKYLDKVINL